VKLSVALNRQTKNRRFLFKQKEKPGGEAAGPVGKG
jgi:hypothetical protein